MIKQEFTLAQQARVFGCSIEQARAGHAKNSKQAAEMAVKAGATGKRLNGYTAAQWNESAILHARIAAGDENALFNV